MRPLGRSWRVLEIRGGGQGGEVFEIDEGLEDVGT